MLGRGDLNTPAIEQYFTVKYRLPARDLPRNNNLPEIDRCRSHCCLNVNGQILYQLPHLPCEPPQRQGSTTCELVSPDQHFNKRSHIMTDWVGCGWDGLNGWDHFLGIPILDKYRGPPSLFQSALWRLEVQHLSQVWVPESPEP